MWPGLLWGILCFIMVHICVWFSTNLQFMSEDIASKSLAVAVLLAIPITLFAYYVAHRERLYGDPRRPTARGKP